jgi:hypothetical protein
MRMIRRVVYQRIHSGWWFLIWTQGMITTEDHCSMVQLRSALCCQKVVPFPSLEDMRAFCTVVDEVRLA